MVELADMWEKIEYWKKCVKGLNWHDIIQPLSEAYVFKAYIIAFHNQSRMLSSHGFPLLSAQP